MSHSSRNNLHVRATGDVTNDAPKHLDRKNLSIHHHWLGPEKPIDDGTEAACHH